MLNMRSKGKPGILFIFSPFYGCPARPAGADSRLHVVYAEQRMNIGGAGGSGGGGGGARHALLALSRAYMLNMRSKE